MIISFAVVLALAWLKEEVASDEFEDHACKTPQISRGVIVNTQHHFWSSVLTSLNTLSEVKMSPAPISQIAYLHIHILIYKGTSFMVPLIVIFMAIHVLFLHPLSLFLLLLLLHLLQIEIVLQFIPKISLHLKLVPLNILIESHIRH